MNAVKVTQGVAIKENAYTRIELKAMHMTVPNGVGGDVLEIGNSTGEKVLVSGCDVYGGSDGVSNMGMATKLHINDDTEIRFAASRGIFSNSDFLIEDSEVSNCGAYGIKARGGAFTKGECDIQPGPWDHSITHLGTSESYQHGDGGGVWWNKGGAGLSPFGPG